jgi:Phage protein
VPHNIEELYGIPISEIARICKVSVKTATRWKDGHTVPPNTARMLLAGDLGAFDPSWAGWVCRRGLLISPEGWEITVGDVLSIPLMRHQVAAWRAEVRRMKEAVAKQEQPAPDAWPEWSLPIAR